MKEDRIETISPIIDRCCPDLSDAEKSALTVELREYLTVLYRIYCRLDVQELLDRDSRDSDDDDILGVAKIPPA